MKGEFNSKKITLLLWSQLSGVEFFLQGTGAAVYNGVYNGTEAAYVQYGNSKSVRLLLIIIFKKLFSVVLCLFAYYQ
jgi:hypothetical protein